MAPGFFSLLGVVTPVFVIVAAGLGLRRLGWLSAAADESLLRVGVNFLFPCLIARTILGNPLLDRAANLLVAPLIGFAGVVIGFAVAGLAARSLRLASPTARAFTFTTGLQNYSYVPLPLVLALFPPDTAGVLFTHNLGVEIALWTVGVVILGGGGTRNAWRKIFNVPICALLASIALNAVHGARWLPAFLLKAMELIGQSAVPLALLLTGATLADLLAAKRGPSSRRQTRNLVAATVVRLAILPLILLALARWLPLSRELRQIVLVQAAMPAALVPIILTRHYGADSAISVGIVISTTALSLCTIPAWLRFGGWFIGA